MNSQHPQNVGILAIEFYCPVLQVPQVSLERYDGVPGKYTEGLGQVNMSFCSDREDAISMSLTVVNRLLHRYGVSPTEIGRLEAASESSVDRSKSIKSHLMRLFQENNSIEGVDCLHGCYASATALFNAVAWVESSGWDGRLALIVAADVAIYAKDSPARPTGGCGAVALLVGPDAPLALEPRWRSTFSAHQEDFCKPHAAGPFPVFDGPVSTASFLQALDSCCAGLHAKARTTSALLGQVACFVSHSPYNKLARKAFCRLMLQDMLRFPGDPVLPCPPPEGSERWDPNHMPEASCSDKGLERALMRAADTPALRHKVEGSFLAQRQCGNMYTASLWAGLASLLEARGEQLLGNRLLLFAFGSGCMATLFSLIVRNPSLPAHRQYSIARISRQVQVRHQLEARRACTPAQYDECLQQLETAYGQCPFSPVANLDLVAEDAFYLEAVDEGHRRIYLHKPAPQCNGNHSAMHKAHL